MTVPDVSGLLGIPDVAVPGISLHGSVVGVRLYQAGLRDCRAGHTLGNWIPLMLFA